MRLVLVNPLHPESGLVGAVRFWRLAEELARIGHRVVMLCGSHCGLDTPATLADRLEDHDWSRPLTVAFGNDSRLDPHGTGGSDERSVFGKLRTAWALAVKGGPFWRWRAEARGFHVVLRDRFQPDLCYATFGNLDTLGIARELASACRIPWVMDIKDPADAFLPASIRPWLMRRYTDAAAVTLNADFQRDHNAVWCRPDAETLYSGVEDNVAAVMAVDPRNFALVGSIYDDQALAMLLRGLARYAAGQANDTKLTYFGRETERVRSVAVSVGVGSSVECAGMIERTTMLRRCAAAAAVCYIGHAGTFHHKLLELAGLGRPLIVCPSESREGASLIERYKVQFTASSDEAALACAFESAAHASRLDTTDLRRDFGWPAIARRLEAMFTRVLSKTATALYDPA